MRYQLVIQLTSPDLDGVIELEDLVRRELGDLGVVDGHDFGLGEGNVFIHTNGPKLALAHLKGAICHWAKDRIWKAGFRKFTEDEYRSIHPVGLKRFDVA